MADETSDSQEETANNYIDYQSLPTLESDCELEPAEDLPPTVDCPTCEPNPAAPLIDWTKRKDTEPFLNQRKCTYSITLVTKYEGTGGRGQLQSRLDEYVPEAVYKLLAHYNKALDANTIAAAMDMAGATDYFIPPRVKLKMKVLVELPANEFDALPNTTEVPEVDEAAEQYAEDLGVAPTESDTSATVDFGVFDQQMDKLIEGLKVYAKFQAIFYQTQRGTVRFPGGAPVNLQSEADHLRKIRPALYEWLRTKGWVIRDQRGKSRRSQPGGKGVKEAEKMELAFNLEGKITSITLYPHGTCAEDPTTIEGMKVYSLSNMFPFNRETTVNWLKNLDDIEMALTQRQGMMKWTEFATTFVYPQPTVNEGADITSTVSALASAAVGQATDKDLDTIAMSTMTMTDTGKIEAKTPGSWEDFESNAMAGMANLGDSLQNAQRASNIGPYTASDSIDGGEPANDPRLASGAMAQSQAQANEWPRHSENPDHPTYRGPQEIWDPNLNNGRGGYRMETDQEAHQRANQALADANSHLTTSSEFVESMCDFDPKEWLNDLGEDFMNEIFSIWDAIQYQFHNFICMTPEQRAEMLEKFQEANDEALADAIREATKILLGFFEMIDTLKYNLEEIKDIKNIYKKGMDEITFCGLFDLMSAFIECLAQGFDMEELLQPLLTAALSAMPPLAMEKLFFGLPAEDQDAILAKVQAHIGSHAMPWDAKGSKDPSAESPFGNRPLEGSTGRSMAITKGGVAKEKTAAKQDHTAVTPKLQAIAKRLEGLIESERSNLQNIAERDSDAQAWADYQAEYEGDPEGPPLTQAQIENRNRAEEVSLTTVYETVLADSSAATILADYFSKYEIPGQEGVTAATISSAPGSYASALQDLLDRVNSADSISLTTKETGGQREVDELDEKYPGVDGQWKAYYYQHYALAMDMYLVSAGKDDETGEALPPMYEVIGNADCAADKGSAPCQEAAAIWADQQAAAFANGMDAADQGRVGDPGPYGTRGSLGAALGSTVSMVLTTYVTAIIEHYSDIGFKALQDALDKTPGGQIIAKIIALLDCSLPPLWDPPLLDYLKTLQIDFCNMVTRMTLPPMPKIEMPNWKDFFKYLLLIAKEIIEYILLRLLIWLLTKIVMILFDSLCAALEKLADMAMDALADAACAAMSNAGEAGAAIADAYQDAGMCESPPRNLLDMMKEALCGPGASDEEAQAAANNAMRNLAPVTGDQAARMANEDSTNQLIADISAVLTGGELTNLLLGNTDPVAVEMVRQVVQTENPVFISALGNEGQIVDLFKNMGNLLPTSLKNQLRANQDTIPAGRPANPFLCTTKEEIARFKEMRRGILMSKEPSVDGVGGTTAEEADEQFDAMRGRALNDIAEMASIMQAGVDGFLADNMPPLLGEPDENGCIPANAVIPRDPDELMEIIGNANESLYDTVEQSYFQDVIGEKGCLAMILSDTNGLPWKRHQRKSRRQLFYSDYSGELLSTLGIDNPADTPFEPLSKRETGFYPKYVGQYFRDYLTDGKHNPDGYLSTSEFNPGEYEYYPAEGIPGSLIPVGSYPKTSKGEDIGTEENPFYTAGQKEPDLTLQFRDNNRGIHPPWLPEEMRFSDGFNLDYSSYIIDEVDGVQVTNTDNVYQLGIVDIANPMSWTPGNLKQLKDAGSEFPFDFELGEEVEEEKFLLTITGSLSEEAELIRNDYNLSKLNLSPQINAWNEFLMSKYAALGLTDAQIDRFETIQPMIGAGSGSVTHDNMMDTLLQYMGLAIANNEPAYIYGFNAAEDDDLNAEDKVYMGPPGFEDKTFMEYVRNDLADQLGDKYKRKSGRPNMRKLKKYVKNNQIMGTSRHPRMHFLNPDENGGSWFRPPYYIEPPVYEGWLGVRDALVPELDGKDPKRTPVCNFKDIKDRVDELTKKMPDDPRLSECPDCVQELPYARILDRASAAGMEGPILSIIRIYVVEEFLKALPVFSKFKARIPEVMDYTYVEYILANMKEDFTERLGKRRGFLKGDALWYTFLEQCVQSFARQMQLDGREASPEVQLALDALNGLHEEFVYPSEEQWQSARRKAGLNPWAKFNLEDTSVSTTGPEIVFGRKVKIGTKLKWYRRWHLLQAVKDTEHHANTIVRTLIEEQMEYMADRFDEALADINMKPDISNIYEFFVGSSGMVEGTVNYSLDKESQSGVSPVVFDVGYARDEDDTQSAYSLVYSGERLNNITNPLEQYDTFPRKLDAQAIITRETPVEGVEDAPPSAEAGGSAQSRYNSRHTTGEFFLEKYVRITDKNDMGLDIALPDPIANRSDHLRGVVNISDWKRFLQSALMAEHQDKRLSEFFGNLEFTYATDDEGNLTDEITGIEGEMGIKYGLRLCYVPPEDCVSHLSAFWEGGRTGPGSALHEGLKEGENWASIWETCQRERAFYMDPAEVPNEGLNVTGRVVVDEDGNTVVASAELETFLDEQWAGDRGTFTGSGWSKYTIQGSRYIIPLVSAEYDALDHTIGNHIENMDTEFDLYCLGKELVNDPEFQFLFQYVFPINRLVSLMSIYTGMGFMMSIGEKVKEISLTDINSIFKDGYPVPNAEEGEWQAYVIRRMLTRGGRSYDGFDFESLFPKTKKSLVQMFRSYFKSREFLAHKDNEDDGNDFKESEKKRKSTRKDTKKKKKGKRGSRKMRGRRRDRPFDKYGN